MKQITRSTAMIALTLSLAAGPAMAQSQDRTLELQTDDGLIQIPLDTSVPMKLLSEGDVSATAKAGFACPTGGASCDDVQVSMSTSNGGAFTVSPGTVSHGSNVNIQWDSRGAWSCEGSGLPGTAWNNSNPKQPGGSQSVNTGPLTPGTTYQVEVNCSNGPVSDSRTLALTVTEDTVPVPAGCEGVPALSSYPGWSEATSILYNNSTHNPRVFADIFNQPFPGTPNTAILHMQKGRYAAIRFTTPSDLNHTNRGQFNGESAGQVYPFGGDQMIFSIASCPGVFDPQYVDQADKCLKKVNVSTPFYWAGPGHPYAQYDCELQPNTTYYLNILYSQSPAGTMPPVQAPCGGRSSCGSLRYHSYSGFPQVSGSEQ